MNRGIIAGDRFACTAARVFDGERTLADHAVLVENGVVSAVVPRRSLPELQQRFEQMRHDGSAVSVRFRLCIESQ